MACAYLLLNGFPVNIQDMHGKTPLYLATELGILFFIPSNSFIF